MKGTLLHLMLGALKTAPLTRLKAHALSMAASEIGATILSAPGEAVLTQIKS